MQKRTRRNIKNQRMRFIAALTAVVLLTLAVFVGHTIYNVNGKIRQSSFDELRDAAKQLVEELYTSVGGDHTALSAIAAVIAYQGPSSDEELCRALRAYGFEASYLSYLEVLRPDGTLLDADGTVRDVSGTLDFAAEAAKGEYISGICQSTRDENEKVIRHAAPIRRDGQVVGILYGVVRLSELAEEYRTNLYDGHAYVYIVDGDTGDFILDTWHKSLGNLIELGKRKTLPGYDLDVAIANTRAGVGGELGFVSRSTGSVLYMRYEPSGVNNWCVMVTVEEQYALAKGKLISASLYVMAGVIGVVMLLYAVCVIVTLLGAYEQVRKLGTEDQSTGLQNRNRYDEYLTERQERTFASIACVYVDANGLHALNNRRGHAAGDKLLRAVADALKPEFAPDSLFRVGGDEFVAFSETDDLAAVEARMARVSNAIEKEGYSVSYGALCYQNETGLDRIVHEADELMLKNKGTYYQEHDRRRM